MRNIEAQIQIQTQAQAQIQQIDLDILDQASKFCSLALPLDVEIEPCSVASTRALQEFDDTKKQSILATIQNENSLFADFAVSPEPTRKRIKDVEFAKIALRQKGLKVSDDMWANVTEGDIIEIYNLDMTQIFRSMSFFKYTKYSLLDLSVFEWYSLYERPKAITELMHLAVGKVIEGNIGFMVPDAPKHVMKQINNTGLTTQFAPAMCELLFKGLGCVWDKKTNEIKGIISTCEATMIAQGEEETNQVQFL